MIIGLCYKSIFLAQRVQTRKTPEKVKAKSRMGVCSTTKNFHIFPSVVQKNQKCIKLSFPHHLQYTTCINALVTFMVKCISGFFFSYIGLDTIQSLKTIQLYYNMLRYRNSLQVLKKKTCVHKLCSQFVCCQILQSYNMDEVM